MFRDKLALLTGLISFMAPVAAVTLFAADSGGNVTTLSFKEGCGSSSLTVTSRTSDCEANPSWLTLDREGRILYCYDRGTASGNSATTSGSLNSFSIGEDGQLTRISRVRGPFSGVAGELIESPTGARGYVSASYNRSAIGVFAVGDGGILPGPGPLQEIFPTIEETGPVPSRQDRSFSHHVIIDPTGQYVLVPDLGGDRIRVFTYDDETIAPLQEVGALVAEPGSGPRHGFFRTAANGDLFFFFNGELDQTVYSYRVEYQTSGLTFTKVFEIPALNADLPATTAPASEIAMSPDGRFLVVSNREKSFPTSPEFGSGPSDTLSTFSINEDGTLDLIQLAPSGGWLPRQFSFNKKGDMIAVGHQPNQTVVIWKRDLETGKIITEEEGGKLGQVRLSGPVVFSLWYEDCGGKAAPRVPRNQ